MLGDGGIGNHKSIQQNTARPIAHGPSALANSWKSLKPNTMGYPAEASRAEDGTAASSPISSARSLPANIGSLATPRTIHDVTRCSTPIRVNRRRHW